LPIFSFFVAGGLAWGGLTLYLEYPEEKQKSAQGKKGSKSQGSADSAAAD